MSKKTFKQKLIEMQACEDSIPWVGDRTEQQAWKECQRGDWLLWYYAKKYPRNIRKLTLAKGLCANTVRHLMKDKRSRDAVDMAIKFGEGKATKEQLTNAASAALAALAANAASAAYAVYAAASADFAAHAAASAADAAYAANASLSAKKRNQKKTANICRKILGTRV